MGYTNYWKFKSSDVMTEMAFKMGKMEIRQFIKWCKENDICQLDIETFIDNITDETTDEIYFNGVGDNGHETFYLHETVKQSMENYEFCKTVRKDYDKMVIACLFILKKYMHGAIQIKSDGYHHKDFDSQYDSYCDDEILIGYKLFKRFQVVTPNPWKTGGLKPLFEPFKRNK